MGISLLKSTKIMFLFDFIIIYILKLLLELTVVMKAIFSTCGGRYN